MASTEEVGKVRQKLKKMEEALQGFFDIMGTIIVETLGALGAATETEIKAIHERLDVVERKLGMKPPVEKHRKEADIKKKRVGENTPQ